MRRGVVGLDKGLMAILELRRRAGEGELIVVEAPLDVEMRLHQVLIAFALGAGDRRMGFFGENAKFWAVALS
jgi:hypothetical protein